MAARRNPTEPEWSGLYAYGWKATYSKDEKEVKKGISLLQKFLVRLEEDPEQGSATHKRKILRRLAEVLSDQGFYIAAADFWRKYEESLPRNMKRLDRPDWYVRAMKEIAEAKSSRAPRRYIQNNPSARKNSKVGEHPTVRYARIMRIIEDPRTNEGYRVNAINAKTKMEVRYPELDLPKWYLGFQLTRDYVPPPKAKAPEPAKPTTPPPPPPKPQPPKKFRAQWLNNVFEAAERAATYYGYDVVMLSHLLEGALTYPNIVEALRDLGEDPSATLNAMQDRNVKASPGRFNVQPTWATSVEAVHAILLRNEAKGFSDAALDEFDLLNIISSASRMYGGNVIPSLRPPDSGRLARARRRLAEQRAAREAKLKEDEESSKARAADLRARREKLKQDRSQGGRFERHWRAWNYGDSSLQQKEMIAWMEEPGSEDEPGYLKWDDNLLGLPDKVWRESFNVVASNIPTPEGRAARADLWSIAPSPKLFKKKNMIQCSALQAILLLSLLAKPISWGTARSTV